MYRATVAIVSATVDGYRRHSASHNAPDVYLNTSSLYMDNTQNHKLARAQIFCQMVTSSTLQYLCIDMHLYKWTL